jgi:pyruvate/2-oxoglutarate dehydrogenase complex dihydrolipoamide acyltransferase (E2) component
VVAAVAVELAAGVAVAPVVPLIPARAELAPGDEAAVRLADDLGIDLAEVEGTGSEGRITVQRRPRGRGDVTDREPDVEIAAAVRANELRFERKPADSPAEAESVSERENLPDELEPGVTYRDFGVHWRVAARLQDPDE